MFGWGKDPKQKKLEKLIELLGRGNDQVKAEVLVRLKHAAFQFYAPINGVDSFAELKFALRPDQTEAVADKAVELQIIAVESAETNEMDEMVFFFCEASLRHKTGHKWVIDRAARLIDGWISVAEGFEGKIK